MNSIDTVAGLPPAELTSRSLELATGNRWLATVAIRNVPVQYDGLPIGKWGSEVNRVEADFAPKYDSSEYRNPGLRILNVEEFQLLSDALGQPNPTITEVDGEELRGCQWLDIGCGTGRITTYAASLGAKITAIDQTPQYVEITAGKLARMSAAIEPPTLIAGPVESLPDALQGQGVVSAMFAVLNHCENWQDVVRDLASRLNTGGTFVASMYGSPRAAVFEELAAGLPYAPAILVRRAEGGLLLGEDAYEVLPAKFPYPLEVEQSVANAGLEVERMVPLLTVTSLYPQDPNAQNIAAYIQVIERRYGSAIADELRSAGNDPEALLVASLRADSQIPLDKIDEAAYYGIVARKPKASNA